MAIRNKELTVSFLVWDTENNRGKTGDTNNITLRIIKDGGAAAAVTNSVAEVNAADMPGVYRVALTAAEMNADFVCVSGKSVSANTVVYPAFIQTEQGDLKGIVDLLNEIKNAIPADLSDFVTKTDLEDAVTAIRNDIAGVSGQCDCIDGKASTIAEIKNNVDNICNSGVKLNTNGKQDVVTNVHKAITEESLAELTALPGADPTLAQAVMLSYMALRNRTENSSDIARLFNSNDVALATADVRDNGTVFTKHKFV